MVGIALCGREGCDGTFRVNATQKGYEGRKPIAPGYQCAECLKVRRKQADVDDLINAVMIARLQKPDALDELAHGNPGRLKELRATISALEANLLLYAEQAADDEITDDRLSRLTSKIRSRIEAAKEGMRSLHPSPGILQLAGPDAAERWNDAPLELKRAVIRAMAVVTILPIGSGKRWTPESVRIQCRRADGHW